MWGVRRELVNPDKLSTLTATFNNSKETNLKHYSFHFYTFKFVKVVVDK
jgi:hypothetical protein